MMSSLSKWTPTLNGVAQVQAVAWETWSEATVASQNAPQILEIVAVAPAAVADPVPSWRRTISRQSPKPTFEAAIALIVVTPVQWDPEAAV